MHRSKVATKDLVAEETAIAKAENEKRLAVAKAERAKREAEQQRHRQQATTAKMQRTTMLQIRKMQQIVRVATSLLQVAYIIICAPVTIQPPQ